MSGLFDGKTTGAALVILFENGDIDSSAYESFRVTPRPGQADFVAFRKYGGFNDYRGGGIFSGRLTAALVAAGVIAKRMIHPASVEARLLEAGGSGDIERAIQAAVRDRDSIGGVVECRAKGLPIGLGEPLIDSAESLLGHLIFAIPGIKGVEFGAGFAGSRMAGSKYNDEIVSTSGETKTNNAGGINGGITNGNELVLRAAVRPTASISKSQSTIDMETGERRRLSVEGRHDACFAIRVPVIVEAATAIVMADLMLLDQKIPKTSR
jgi:chorismate synthase